MACFIVPGVEAIVVTAVTAAQKKKEKKLEEARVTVEGAPALPEETTEKVPLSRKLRWLKYMLWGGVILLAFEHLWHGEIVPYPPFLTALHDPGDTATMFREMASVGITMAALITGVWGLMCLVADKVLGRSSKKAEEKA